MTGHRAGAGRRVLLLLLAFGAAALALASLSPEIAAASPAGRWKLESYIAPTNLKPGGEGELVLVAANLGDADINGEGEEVTIAEPIPAGLEASGAVESVIPGSHEFRSTKSAKLPCTASLGQPVVCKSKVKLEPFYQMEVFIPVKATVAFPTVLESELKVTGGGLPEATLDSPLNISEEAVKFGVEDIALSAENEPENEHGLIDTQAGSHPFQLTTTFNLSESFVPYGTPGAPDPGPGTPALQRNVSFQLPPGLIGDANVLGNPDAVAQCSGADFGKLVFGTEHDACPADTAIGVALVTINEPTPPGEGSFIVPVFNLTPPPGEPAQFGFFAAKVPVVINTSLRTGGDYGATVTVKNTSEIIDLLRSRVTIWGVPTAAEHDSSRGWVCLDHFEGPGTCEQSFEVPAPAPFLTMPTSCNGPTTATVAGDSWPAEDGKVSTFGEGGENEVNTSYKMPALTGCSLLGFTPSFDLETEHEEADTPTEANTPEGLTVKVHVPQASTQEAGGLAEAAVKDTVVEFPAGLLLNPSAANSLEACPEGLNGVGFTGTGELNPEGEPKTLSNLFTSTLPEPLEPGKNFCSNASKVGVVHIQTPDLPNELEGGVYLAEQTANPFGSLFAMYLVAQDPVSKVLVKLAGEVGVNPDTGRITSSFVNTPDAPFEDLKLQLFGGPQASLTTPPTCGSYPTKAVFTPWSGTAPAVSSSSFKIEKGAEGGACPGTLPFSPAFKAGSTNPQAGAFTSFELNIAHPDADQPLSGVEMKLPDGIAGLLSSVTLCPEPQAAEGTCPEDSKIGDVTASAGLGSEPFTETTGASAQEGVFITGPYDGAPFGLTVVVPTETKAFNFGDVVTRSTININPTTAALTISSPLPTMVETARYHGVEAPGVPVQLKSLHVTVNRPGFQFNPTNCEEMKITGTLKGAQGATDAVSYPFKVSGCEKLPFEPKLTATVSGQGSKEKGVTFAVKVESPGVGQANIHKVDLTLPGALPSRLSTIEKACLVAVFNANPASCPEGSDIGYAVVHTPVLKSALTGPAYLVSYGAEKFPDVEFVLQGEGITLIVDGQTDIKKGITYSKFETAPDAPFNTFETVFPEGTHSALTAYVPEDENYNLCTHTLTIPTEIEGQNGAFISEDTNVTKTNCVLSTKVEHLTNAQKLAKALAACRAKYKGKKHKTKRVKCEKQAQKKYGKVKKSAKKAKKSAKKNAKKR